MLEMTLLIPINEHLRNIHAEGELDPEATIRRFRTVRRERAREVTRLIDHYSLAAILAVGYRVRSPRGAQFQGWAADRLSEYLVKGFTLDDRRLKNPPVHGEGVLQPALRGRFAACPTIPLTSVLFLGAGGAREGHASHSSHVRPAWTLARLNRSP